MNKKIQRDFKSTQLVAESLKLLNVHRGAEFLLGKPIKVGRTLPYFSWGSAVADPGFGEGTKRAGARGEFVVMSMTRVGHRTVRKII